MLGRDPDPRDTMVDELIFFSKRDCPLCDHGFPAAQRLAAHHGLCLRKVDIETNASWLEEYGERIPVLCFRDRVLGWGRLSERALERELAKVLP
ncbi:MAG: glutaredoxin family protein [bacterium]|nr:thioredoxin family protein [Deltaproteobacteria bacterium]MCP4245313.1 glutaredoxin family protein [bacterium]